MKFDFHPELSIPSDADVLAIAIQADDLDALRKHALLTDDQRGLVNDLIKREVVTGKPKTQYFMPASVMS